MIVGLGLDICPVERAREMLDNAHFMERIFTRQERAYLDARGAGRMQSAAGLYAAKEAVVKALGTGIGHADVSLAQVEIGHDACGAPRITLRGAACERLRALGGKQIHVNITHDGGIAAAVAIAEGE